MCELVMFAVSTGLAVAQAGMQVSGQRQTAKAQAQQAAQIEANARQNYVNQLDALQQQRHQESARSSQAITEHQREAARARATAQTAAGEAGVSGLSVDALMRDYHSRELNYIEAVRTNYRNTSNQIDRQMDAARTGFQSTVNAAPLPTAPNYLDAGLRIGAEAFDAYDRYLHRPQNQTQT